MQDVIAIDFDGFFTINHTYDLHRDQNGKFTKNLSDEFIRNNLRNPDKPDSATLKITLENFIKHGYKIVITSFHGDIELIKRYLKVAGMENYFDLILTAKDIPNFNPTAAQHPVYGYWKSPLYSILCQRYGIGFDKITACDDTEGVIENAKKLGCKTIYAPPGNNSYLEELVELHNLSNVSAKKTWTNNIATMLDKVQTTSASMLMSQTSFPNTFQVLEDLPSIRKYIPTQRISYSTRRLLHYFDISFDNNRILLRNETGSNHDQMSIDFQKLLDKLFGGSQTKPKLAYGLPKDKVGTCSVSVYLNEREFNQVIYTLTGQQNAFHSLANLNFENNSDKPDADEETQSFSTLKELSKETSKISERSFWQQPVQPINVAAKVSSLPTPRPIPISQPKNSPKNAAYYIESLEKWANAAKEKNRTTTIPSICLNAVEMLRDIIVSDESNKNDSSMDILNQLSDNINQQPMNTDTRSKINLSSLLTILEDFQKYLKNASSVAPPAPLHYRW